MADSNSLDPQIHPEAASLPWFLNGTLRGDEHQRVARHLEACAICRAELAELAQLRQQVKEVYAAQPGPSAQAARSVMAHVEQEASTRAVSRATDRHWLDGVEAWFRSLFLHRWAPTLAAVLLVAQFALLLWAMNQQVAQDQVTSRSVGTPTIRLRAVFQESTSEQQIRSVLQEVRGRIVDGPAQDGGYIIEVPAGDPATAQRKLDTLKGHADVIRFIETVKP